MSSFSASGFSSYGCCSELPIKPVYMSKTGKRCILLLEQCRNMKQLKQAHSLAITSGIGTTSFVLSRLLEFCSNPQKGSLSYAWHLFQHIHHPTICIYNTIIKALLLQDELWKVIFVYRKLLMHGMCPDNYTLPYVLKACAKLESCFLGRLIHGQCLKLDLVVDRFVGNGLMSMYFGLNDTEAARQVFDEIPAPTYSSWTAVISGYAKVGDTDMARFLFDRAPIKDRGIWGAMISGYVQNNCFKEGLYLFRLMQLEGIEPDEAIFVSVICACANLGALDAGVWIHGYLRQCGTTMSLNLVTSLIDMYAKCGNFDMAKKLFDGVPYKDLICWNAMISGMAMHGEGQTVLKLFAEMEQAGVRPDDITFMAVFTACSYSGLAVEGLRILGRMCNVYNIALKSEHYGCMVELLSRSGFLEEANKIVQGMPDGSNPSVEAVAWRALLSASCNDGQAQLAEAAAHKLLQLERHSGVYVLLSNMYASTGRHEDANGIRKLMKRRGVDKAPGCSSTKINGVVHEFVAGEKTHSEMELIQSTLERLDRQTDSFFYF